MLVVGIERASAYFHMTMAKIPFNPYLLWLLVYIAFLVSHTRKESKHNCAANSRRIATYRW